MSEYISEYIVRETGYPGTLNQEIVGELVRCKDCKYYEETNSRIGTCLLTISGAEVDGFCAWGERKDDE